MKGSPIKRGFSQRKNQRGFSLIEIVISMLVLAVVFGGLLNFMTDFSKNKAIEQKRRSASMAAKQLMEEVKSRKFDSLTTKDGITGWSAIGIDTGETSGNKATFNDVDDYNGLSETLASPFAGLTRSTAVTYVSSADLTTASASRLNDYKRITIQVLSGATVYAQLVTVVSAAVSPS